MYNQQSRPQLPRLSSRDTPLTIILIGASVLTFLLDFFLRGDWLVRGLALTAESLHFPWTVVTWPLLGVGLLGTIFTGLWVWTLGGSMERAWGTARLLKFFLATTLITSLTVLPVLLLLGAPGAAFAGLSTAFSPVALAWCWINRRETILFNFIFPIPALWIAALTAAFVFFGTASALGNPFAGFAGLSGCAAAWWWVRGGEEWAEKRFGKHKKTPNLRFADLDKDIRGARPSNNPFKKAREERERQDRDKKIAEMFRNSGYKDEQE
jgi:membrane associated rhomboid family serine protease